MNTPIKFPLSVLVPIKNYLMKEQQELLKRKDALKKEDPFADINRVNDNADVGQEASEQWGHQRVEALRLEIDRMLVIIRKSLTKIKLGKYGLCEQCGKMIDTDRLAINPTSVLCISCERKKQEQLQKKKKK